MTFYFAFRRLQCIQNKHHTCMQKAEDDCVTALVPQRRLYPSSPVGLTAACRVRMSELYLKYSICLLSRPECPEGVPLHARSSKYYKALVKTHNFMPII